MTVEIHDKLITLLAEVDDLKSKEAQLRSEKTRHLEQMALSESEVAAATVDESQLRLEAPKWTACVTSFSLARRKRKPSLLMMRHVVTDEENSQTDSEAKRAWDAKRPKRHTRLHLWRKSRLYLIKGRRR
jgi:hypothetical protein